MADFLGGIVNELIIGLLLAAYGWGVRIGWKWVSKNRTTLMAIAYVLFHRTKDKLHQLNYDIGRSIRNHIRGM